MPLDYARLMASGDDALEYTYDNKTAMLYALSVGMGRNPINLDELDFVYEKQLKVLPSLATVVSQGKAMPDASCGWDAGKVLHGEQRLTLHRPLPLAATILVRQRVVACHDRGPEKGALILTELEARLKDTGELLYTLGNSLVARGDGGFGGINGSGPAVHVLPERTPDSSFEVATNPNQALYYRLLGDMNPLHADPALATKVGFRQPILHGRCIFGIACYSVVAAACNYDASKVKEFNARFSSVMYPGETIITDFWIDGDIVSFRCRLKERDVTVLNNGMCRLG